MKFYTCLVLFDLSGGPRLLDALGSRYPDFWFKQAKRANVQLSFQRKKYGMLNLEAVQAAACYIDTRYGSSGAHSLVVYIKTGGRRGRFERLPAAVVEAARTGGPGSGPAGTSGALRCGAIEPGIEPGGHLVVEHCPAQDRHRGGAQLCSLQRRATRCPDRLIHF
jgi:hypothetical protein